jgi:hypothetical protein
MFDIWRKDSGEKIPPLTSPTEAAFRYSETIPGSRHWKDVDYGSSFDTLSLLLEGGGCPYYNELDFNRDIRGDRWSEFQKLENLLFDYNNLSKRKEKGKKTAGWFSQKTPEEKQVELIKKVACLNISNADEGEIKELADFIQKAIETPNSMTFFKKYFEKGCDKRRLKASGRLRILEPTDKSEKMLQSLKQNLDRALEAGKGVPGISYCSGVLHNQGYEGMKIKGLEPRCPAGDAHVSIVVNRRQGKSGCEYLVRNSYGVSCNAYPWPCSKGQVWVPEKELLKNLTGVQWIE